MPMPLVKFRDWVCDVQVLRYPNGRPALVLSDAETGEPIARATVNLPDEAQKPNHVFVKNCDENEGIMQALVEARIITPAHRIVSSGFITVGECRLVQEVD